MKTKVLRQASDYKIFALECSKKLNLDYPLEYLMNAKVRAFYNKYGAMIGGYVLNFNGRFRVIESIPAHVKKDSPWINREVLNNSYEVTGLWLDHRLGDIGTNFIFWLTMYKDMIMTRRKYLVYAYDLDKTYLKKLYSNLKPKVIFSGKTIKQVGMHEACEESIEIASVNHLRLCILYRYDYFLKKLLVPARKMLRGLKQKVY